MGRSSFPPGKAFFASRKWGGITAAGTIAVRLLRITKDCRLRSWGGSRLGAHTNLDRVRKGRVCVKVGIIVAVTGGSSRVTGKSIKLALRRENPNSGQRFRASGELEGDRDPVCPGLGSSFLRTSEITYWRHGKDGLVTGFFIFSSSHCCSVDSATYEAFLSLNCQGVDGGCTWSALCWRGSGLHNM